MLPVSAPLAFDEDAVSGRCVHSEREDEKTPATHRALRVVQFPEIAVREDTGELRHISVLSHCS